MDDRLKSLDSTLATVSQKLVSLKALIASSFTKVETNFSIVSRNLVTIEKTLKELKFKVDNLDTTTSSGLNEVGTKIESLTEEIGKIGAVTQYDEMYKNQQGLRGN